MDVLGHSIRSRSRSLVFGTTQVPNELKSEGNDRLRFQQAKGGQANSWFRGYDTISARARSRLNA